MDTASWPLPGDADGDGVDAPADCDDNDALVYPGAQDIPYDGEDQDCDGEDLVDVDGDGIDADVAGGEDCEDGDPTIPRDEDCDTLGDEDCDGELDEGCPALADPADPGGLSWTCAVADGPASLSVLIPMALFLLLRAPTTRRR